MQNEINKLKELHQELLSSDIWNNKIALGTKINEFDNIILSLKMNHDISYSRNQITTKQNLIDEIEIFTSSLKKNP